jgi:cytochrome P450 PksS
MSADSAVTASTTASTKNTAPTPSFTFHTPAFKRDPYPFYAELRRDMPIIRMKAGMRGTGYFVSRYDDCMALMRDVDRFVNDKRNAGHRASWLEKHMSMGMTDAMIMRDGVDHRRLRNLAHKAFTPTRVAALEQRIQELTEQMLDAADKKGSLDLVEDLALPLPIAVISEMMGVEEKHRRDFHHWMNGILELDGAGPIDMLGNVPNMIKLNRFLRKLIEDRRKNKGDDLLSAMVDAEEAGERLSFDELVASTLIILLAGHETTVNLIGNGMLALLEHPEQMARLRAEPSLMDSAVEEFLRYTSPVQINAPRFTVQDTELCGVRIPRGASVAPLLGAANRDDAHFADPDRFDIARTPNKHVAFGFGPHYCLGAPLARLETKAAFTSILRRYPHLELATTREQLTWRRSLSVRGLLSLPLRARHASA